MKILVCAAWEPELTHFRGVTAASSAVVAAAVGVGVVDAAAGVTRWIERERPARALLLGTCGAFAGRAAIGEVVVGASALLVDAALEAGHAALPPPLVARAALDPALRDAAVAAGARSVQIANTVAVTTDDAYAARLAAHSAADVEHLEAFAFARACALAEVPCAIVLGVANVVGSRGRDEWRANHVEASRRAADLAARALLAKIED